MDDNIIPLEQLSTKQEVINIVTDENQNKDNKAYTEEENNNIFVKKSQCPQILLYSLIMMIIFGLALVIKYPYFHYISEYGESQCSVCNCQVDTYIDCSFDKFGNQ